MKMKIYNYLVNRDNGIRQRYHELHDNATDKTGKIKSYAALAGMNVQYALGKRDFGGSVDTKAYEEKALKALSESGAHIKHTALDQETMIHALLKFDVISFDVFDTLLLRPFSEPTDIFFFLGEKLGIMDFKRIRVQQEYLARKEHEKRYGNNEVTFDEIWNRIEREVGVPADVGMKEELALEKHFCFANPFMVNVFGALKRAGKTIVAVSDMYLPSDFVVGLLEMNGFTDVSKVYMSSEYSKSKSKGDLYEIVKSDFKSLNAARSSVLKKKGKHKPLIAHVGDNEHSDMTNALKAGFLPHYFPNVNTFGKSTRAYDMSPVIGGAYRGVVNARLYSGIKKYHPEYEFGYIYGGLFVLGYCNFIREYCRKNSIDKLVFLSRDGDILKRVYDKMYPGSNTEYAYISRSVVTKLMRNHNRYDFLLRFADKMINQGIRIRDILSNMGLHNVTSFLLPRGSSVRPDEILTDKNIGEFKKLIIDNFSVVNVALADFDAAARCYYSSVLNGVNKAAVVDIGWAGSAAVSLSVLARSDWDLETEIIGLVAGTNSVHCAEPDASEEFLQMGKLVPYVFSQALNRDVMKKHDPNKNYNVYWELLLSSPTRQFTGFEFVDQPGKSKHASLELHSGTNHPDDTNSSYPKDSTYGHSEDTTSSHYEDTTYSHPAATTSGHPEEHDFFHPEERSDEGSLPSGGNYKEIQVGDRHIRLLFGKKDYNTKGMRRIQKGIMDFVKDYTEHFKDHPYMFNISGRDAAAPMLLAASHNERYLKEIAKRFDFKIDVS